MTRPDGVDRIVAGMLQIANADADSIHAAGVFGSSARNSAANDIDALLIMAESESSQWYPDMRALHERVSGDYGVTAPTDPSFRDLAARIERFTNETFGIAAWCGLGPIDRGFASRRLHLQGPMGLSGWRSYADEFPIQAWSIRLNFRPIHGPLPYAGAITVAAVRKYVSTMRKRLDTIPSRSYGRKSLQGLCVAAGADNSEYEACRQFAADTGLVECANPNPDVDTSSALKIGDDALSALSQLATDATASPYPIRGRSADG